MFAWITAGFGIYLLARLFAIRWYLRQLDVSLGPLGDTRGILIFSFAATLGLGFFSSF
jgi:hypothetical protein